jgi:hypothetical protein
MRYLAAIVLASLAAIACSSSPDSTEPSASTDQGLIGIGSGSCYSGYTWRCNFMNGHFLCGCEPLSCNWVVPPPKPNYVSWVESYAVGSSDGVCPDVPAPNGTWKELSIVPTCAIMGFAGVPCEWTNGVGPFECKPSDFGTPSCCTYVWWPKGYAPPADCGVSNCASGTPPQFPQVLCSSPGKTIVAIEESVCVGGTCPQPGGGNCGTCASY